MRQRDYKSGKWGGVNLKVALFSHTHSTTYSSFNAQVVTSNQNVHRAVTYNNFILELYHHMDTQILLSIITIFASITLIKQQLIQCITALSYEY